MHDGSGQDSVYQKGDGIALPTNNDKDGPPPDFAGDDNHAPLPALVPG